MFVPQQSHLCHRLSLVREPTDLLKCIVTNYAISYKKRY
uniref:Bm14481 n=1 Tax=Brugia malayi TaxID=6279 RepID=A0A1I9G243_BRUMA|nr:Bm14481 [Brugia malayi]